MFKAFVVDVIRTRGTISNLLDVKQGSKWAMFFVPGPAQSGPKNADARPARPNGPDYKSAFSLTTSDGILVKIVCTIHGYLIT